MDFKGHIRKGGRVDRKVETITCVHFGSKAEQLEIARDALTFSGRVIEY